MFCFLFYFVFLIETRANSICDLLNPSECGKSSQLRPQSHIGIPRACFNPADPGPCSQDLIRLYYDHKTYQCKWFSYSGCGGNANRFVSIKNCYKLCHPYYRQRVVKLNDKTGNEDPEPEEENQKAKLTGTEQPDEEQDEEQVAAKLKRQTSTTEAETTEMTTESTTTEEEETETEFWMEEEPTGISFFSAAKEEDGGKVFFGNKKEKEEIEPEVKVVHEYSPQRQL